MKYLSPYRSYLDGKRFARSHPDNEGSWYSVDLEDDGRWCMYYSIGTMRFFERKEDAVVALDKILIEEGYTLLTEEQMLLI
jgi:hypothetical protein